MEQTDPALSDANDLLSRALALIDAANAEDPNREAVDGAERPKELVYSERMTRWLERLEPDASVPLQLAVRAQHIQRWTVPRDRYPAGRAGYHRWRSDLARFHADKTAAILRETGFDDATVDRVRSLILKRNLRSDPETQLLEDTACLVFLDHYFADFGSKHDQDKIISILRKTWTKMSPHGQAAGLKLSLPPAARDPVRKAIA